LINEEAKVLKRIMTIKINQRSVEEYTSSEEERIDCSS